MPVIFQYTAKLNTTQILFGILPYTIGNHAAIFCLLYCKYFIHLQQKDKRKANITPFKSYIKNVLEVEKALYVLRGEAKLFANLFDKLIAIC